MQLCFLGAKIMYQNSSESTDMMSVRNIFRAFQYWPRIFQLLWETKKTYFIAIITLSVLNGLMPVSILLALQSLINSIVTSHTYGFQGIIWPFLFFASVSFLNEIIQIVKGYFDNLLRMLLSNHISVLIMEKSINLSLSDFENAKIQDQLNRAQSEAGYRPYQIFQQILLIIRGVITLVSSAAVLIIWKWWIVCIIMGIPLLSFIFFLRVSQQEFFIHWKRSPKNRLLWYFSFLLTRDISFKEIKLFQLGNHFLNEYSELFNEFYIEDKKINTIRTKLSFFFQIINQLVIGFTVLFVIRVAYLGQILVGNVFGLIQAISLTQSSVQNVVGNMLGLCQNNLYIEQLFGFLDLTASEPESTEGLHKENRFLDNDIAKKTLSKIHTIRFENVSFKYPGTDEYVVKNLNLELKKGSTYAVVGKNGSGKSTLVKLLIQLYRSFEGDIYFNGVSVEKIPVDLIRQKIGAIFQDFVQYEMPVRQNIGYGQIELIDHDDKIVKAAVHAGINDLIKKLPNSIETQLGKWFEGGHQLSGGQWQRIAIARSFMKDADIYIMDEPSSFLDAQSEEDIFQKFNDLVKDRIGIFISHRLSSVRYADEIIVMEDGIIVEQGCHDRLMKLNQHYAKLYRLQQSGYVLKAK